MLAGLDNAVLAVGATSVQNTHSQQRRITHLKMSQLPHMLHGELPTMHAKFPAGIRSSLPDGDVSAPRHTQLLLAVRSCVDDNHVKHMHSGGSPLLVRPLQVMVTMRTGRITPWRQLLASPAVPGQTLCPASAPFASSCPAGEPRP